MENGLSQVKKQSDLDSIISEFRNQIERMGKNTSQIESIGNRMRDESNMIKESPNKDPSPDMPGNISYLRNCIEDLIKLNNRQETQIIKLDNII